MHPSELCTLKCVTCPTALAHVISPPGFPFPSHLCEGGGSLPHGTLLAHLPLCPVDIRSLYFSPWLMSLSGAGSRVVSHTSTAWEFPLTPVPQNLLSWCQALGRHTINISLGNGHPQTLAACGRLRGGGGLSKETVIQKRLVHGSQPGGSWIQKVISAARRLGRRRVEGKNCFISPSSTSLGPQMLP